MDNKQGTILVFIDFGSTFDTINQALDWTISYLQQVEPVTNHRVQLL